MSEQFYSKQFSLEQVHNFKSVLFQTIHFSISTQYSSIYKQFYFKQINLA